MNRPLRAICLGILLPLALAASVRAADWPYWRGTARNSVVAEDSGWKEGAAWPAAEVWSGSFGIGSSSPIVAGGRLYTMGWQEGQVQVACVNALTGQRVWMQSYPSPQYGRHAVGDQGLYAGPSATPEYDPATGNLYTLDSDGNLQCRNGKTGASLWQANLYDRYGIGRRPQATPRPGTLRDYGFTTSPVLYKDWLIVEVGDDEGALMAFDKRTGERRWVSESKNPAGHSGGLPLMTVEGVPCVVAFTLKGLLVARLDKGNEGKTVAEYEWITDFDNNVASPTVDGDHVLITSKYNKQAIAKIKVTLKGATKVWEQRYASGVCSPVVYNGHVYFANRGLFCLDYATGEMKWSGGRFGDAASCIITKDGRVIVWANNGDLTLAETADRAPDDYKELAAKPRLFNTEVWPHVALANGHVYCKDRAGNLKCFRLASP